MLQLRNITKNYLVGESEIQALKGIDVEFRENEFVAVLGPSGCGKTTLLNIIGGLDRYTTGDLVINGKSTKEFKDKDWDTYRNHSIGFVFQSYNLIPHQTVLSNVELALTISGVGKKERRKRAIEALEKVGLKDQINKKPNQMSGGQMQRVAIARALVNNPDILLADEPTGALDSETSLQIMEILKEISKDKLIIMVTHNPDLAETYSNRIIKLLDGKIIDDSNPYKATEKEIEESRNKKSKTGKASMKFSTALQLSLNNLMTKKGRTFLTAFAGSIGIIGIALIMSLSNGMQQYINKVEEDTLASYPITIQDATIDMSSLMTSMMGTGDEVEHEEDKVYSREIVNNILETISSKIQTNNLEEFKKFIENGNSNIKDYINAVQYSYNLDLNIYKENEDGSVQQVNPSIVFEKLGFGDIINARDSNEFMSSSTMMTDTDVWTEMLDNKELIESQYDVLAGKFPENYNEVVLIVDQDNQISDYTLYSLGIKDINELDEKMEQIENGEEITSNNEEESYSYDELLNYRFKIILNTDYYEKVGDTWQDMSDDEEYMKNLVSNAEEIQIVGIIKPNEATVTSGGAGLIGYDKSLKEYIINRINETEIVKEQKENPDINVFTGIEFPENNDEEFNYGMLTDKQRAYMATLSQEELTKLIETYTENASATYEKKKKKLGVVDLNKPSSINIYPKDFEAKDSISNIISTYNNEQRANSKEENVINYTDYVGIMMDSVSTIIDVISYVLMAFVSISLIVSSIMIGIITYISVLERTKEIGILRSIGASKKDVSRVFNAETLIIGLVAGVLGIGVTLLLNIPINIIIESIVNISTIATLPVIGGIILVVISVLLTIIAGLIPSRLAAKKDPAEVLRTE